jgi:deazaflavin-dependent oxidoreductase (nitroreductase family)
VTERDWKRFNAELVDEFRSNGGKVTGQFANVPLLLLTTTGAKTGNSRVNPVVYGRDGHDGEDVFVIASNKGALAHPDWYRNLKANPQVKVELPGEAFAAVAVEAEEERRARLYAEMEARWSAFTQYRESASAGRTIPVIVLERSPRP